jgi:uncharacterized protein
MMTRDEVLALLRKHKVDFKKKYHVSNMELFGSYARDEQTNESDVDVMVEFAEPVGIEFVDLLMELEAILGRPVDLVTKKSIRPKLRSYIEPDLIVV